MTLFTITKKFINRFFELAEAAEYNESNGDIYFTAGLIYDMLGESTAALKMFHRAVEANADHSLAILNIGNYFFRIRQYETAMQYYQSSLQVLERGLSPDPTNLRYVLSNLGQCHRERGQLSLALASFYRAYTLALSTGSPEIQGWIVSNIFAVKGMLCYWIDGERIESELLRAITAVVGDAKNNSPSTQAMREMYIDPYSITLMTYSNAMLDRLVSSYACPSRPYFSHPEVVFASKPRMRIGYLSYDWRDHPMGRLTSSLVVHHNLSLVDVTCISYGPDDNSSIRRHIESSCGSFIDISRIANDFEVAARLHALSFDILIDLTSHTYNGRIDITALKPAPIVINYLGYPGTTGCPGYDYSMVDKGVAPPETHRQLFSEKLIYLPYGYQANHMPLDVPPCVGRMACREERAPVFKSLSWFLNSSTPSNDARRERMVWICSFNANKKMEMVSFFTWMNVMRRIPHSLLILQETNIEAMEQILMQVRFLGISPARVWFAPTLAWKDHLYRASTCDIVLDTFVYGAHTTSSDMLWMWVPVLSLASWGSGRMPSRVAAAITESLSLNPVGRSAEKAVSPSDVLVEYSAKGYEDSAIRLLKNIRSLTSLHAIVGGSTLRGPTFDTKRKQADVERAYQLSIDVFNHQVASGLTFSIFVSTTIHRHVVDDDEEWWWASCHPPLQSLVSSNEVIAVEDIATRSLRIRCRRNLLDQNHSAGDLEPLDVLQESVQQKSLARLDLFFADKFMKRESIDRVASNTSSLYKLAVVLEKVVDWQQELFSSSCAEETAVFAAFSHYFFENKSLLEPFFPGANRYQSSSFTKLNYTLIWTASAAAAASEGKYHLAPLIDALLHRAIQHFDFEDNCSMSLRRSWLPVFFNPDPPFSHFSAFMRERLSWLLNGHAVCLNQRVPHRRGCSLQLFSSSFAQFNNTRALMNAGLILMEEGWNDVGFLLSSQAHVIDHLNRYDAHMAVASPSSLVLDRSYSNGLRIAIYCYEYGQGWWPGKHYQLRYKNSAYLLTLVQAGDLLP